MPEESTLLSWSAYEHEHIDRGSDWYWALGIVALSVAATSLLLHDFLFSILIIVAAFTIALHARINHDLANFEISGRGVRVNGEMHRFDEIVSFWVEEEHRGGRPLLLIDTTKFPSPNIIIPIEGVEPATVRALLAERCEEVHMKEPLSHRVFEFLNL